MLRAPKRAGAHASEARLGEAEESGRAAGVRVTYVRDVRGCVTWGRVPTRMSQGGPRPAQVDGNALDGSALAGLWEGKVMQGVACIRFGNPSRGRGGAAATLWSESVWPRTLCSGAKKIKKKQENKQRRTVRAYPLRPVPSNSMWVDRSLKKERPAESPCDFRDPKGVARGKRLGSGYIEFTCIHNGPASRAG